MTFLSMRPHLELCVKSLEEAVSKVKGSGHEKGLAICIDGLKSMLTCLHDYDNTIIKARLFCDSLCRNVRSLNETAADCHKYGWDGGVEGICDLTFQLVEDLAVLMREKSLRHGGAFSSPGEQQLMQYFETCGSWFWGDATLVTEYYYMHLPLSMNSPRRVDQAQ